MQDDINQKRLPFPDYLPESQRGDANSYYTGYRSSSDSGDSGDGTMLKNVEVFIVRVDKKWNALMVGKRSTVIIQPDGNPDIKAFREQLVEDFKEIGCYPRIRHLDNTGLEFSRDEKLTEEIEKLRQMKLFNSRGR